jgi:predicted esterase
VIVVPAGVIRESEIANSWGGDIGTISKAILPLVRDLITRKLVDSNEVYLAGFSQGAQASIELPLVYPNVFRGGIAMSGFASMTFSDSILQVARKAGTRFYGITGEFEDPGFRTQIGNIHALCQKSGIPFTLVIVPGMVHEVPLDLLPKFVDAWHSVRNKQSD